MIIWHRNAEWPLAFTEARAKDAGKTLDYFIVLSGLKCLHFNQGSMKCRFQRRQGINQSRQQSVDYQFKLPVIMETFAEIVQRICDVVAIYNFFGISVLKKKCSFATISRLCRWHEFNMKMDSLTSCVIISSQSSAGPLLVDQAQFGLVLLLLEVKFETCNLEVLAPTCPPRPRPPPLLLLLQ